MKHLFTDGQMDVIGRISKDLAFKDAPIKDPDAEWQEAPRDEGYVYVHSMLTVVPDYTNTSKKCIAKSCLDTT